MNKEWSFAFASRKARRPLTFTPDLRRSFLVLPTAFETAHVGAPQKAKDPNIYTAKIGSEGLRSMIRMP
jgi:hypothetical protein